VVPKEFGSLSFTGFCESFPDDENWIAGSLKEFGKLISAIEDEKDKLLDRSYEQVLPKLHAYELFC
jgi:hypothetical protein